MITEPGADGRAVEADVGQIELSLFDLEKDIGEQHDVSAHHPDVVERLMALADKMRADLGDSATGIKGQNNKRAGTCVKPGKNALPS